LPRYQKRLALAVPAACIAEGQLYSEPQVTAALRACLEAEASFLDVDAVELRRWLIDTGWWIRDGFGRAYERVPALLLPAELVPVAEALSGLNLCAWVTETRGAWAMKRDARRKAWGEVQPSVSGLHEMP
jgi:hypothetical protein